MTEINIPEEEFGEPALNYWQPLSKPVPVAPVAADCMANNYENPGWAYQTPNYLPPPYLPPCTSYQQMYPVNNVLPPYIQNQECDFSPPVPIEGGARRRMSQYALNNTSYDLFSLSANPGYEQIYTTMTDNMIQDEVTRAAKTLFSKRNRTLMHWLNPDVNKNQIKVDTDAAWEMLPAVQKKFFISQVLGKFSPHVSSLMVNPQLDPSQVDNPSPCMVNIFNPSGSRATGFKRRRKKNPEDKKVKPDSNVQMIKTVIKTEVEDSCDSGLVIDIGPEVKSKEVPSVQVQRVKRKYTKRKHKESTLGVNVQNTPNTSLMCALPVRVEDIKVENDLDISNITQPKTELPDKSTEAGETSNKIECGNTKNKKPKVDKNELPLKPKRKYVKRKLVRKKYKKREPKQKPPKDEIVLPEVVGTDNNEPEPEPMNEEEMEIDLWIELEDDSILTNEEVDNFFNGIDDPDHLFSELGIVMENQELPELFNNP